MFDRICGILEITRWVLIVAAFQLAYFFGHDAISRFEILTPLVIISLSGLTGIESVFFGETANKVSGYGNGNRRYQIQSGLNNLAVALTTVIAWACHWGINAYFALMTAVLIFYGMSGINHAASAIIDGNRKWKNIARPFMTALLIVAVLAVMLPALGK
ncbi:MAG: DUF6790 family protein [Negativicutes bacterium]|jgi:hypothetical protein